MAQVKQTCSVTNGSATVIVTGVDLTARLKKNGIFMSAVSLVPYFIAADSVYSGGSTVVTLTGNYVGATSTTLAGVFVTDFTYPNSIPTIAQGDVGTAAVFTAAMNKIQTLLATAGGTVPGTAIIASEALAAGDFVNVFNNAGSFNARKANAAFSTKQATGYVTLAAAVGTAATVYFSGVNDKVVGQTPGDVYLQTTAGLAGSLVPAGSGNIVQNIGVATSATSIIFQAGLLVTLA